jgi:hypothetical protein
MSIATGLSQTVSPADRRSADYSPLRKTTPKHSSGKGRPPRLRPGSTAERAAIERIQRRLSAVYRPRFRRARTVVDLDLVRVRLRLDLIREFARAGVR